MDIISKIKNFFSKSPVFKTSVQTRRFVVTLLIFAMIYTLVALVTAPVRVTVEQGRPSPHTVFASRDAVDEYATNLLREESMQAVQEVYTYDPEVLEEALQEVDDFFELVLTLKEDDEMDTEEKIGKIQEHVNAEVSEAVAREVLRAGNMTLNDLQGRLKRILVQVMEEQGIKAGGLETAKSQVMQEINVLIFSFELKKIAEKIVEPLIRPNMIFNPEATAVKQQEAMEEVEPVIIQRGSRIISEGETVTEEHIAKLEALGLIRGGERNYSTYIGLFLFIFILFFLVGIYLHLFYRDVYNNPTYLILLGFIVVLTLLFAFAAKFFSPYLMPVSVAVILITVLFGHRLAILLCVLLSIILGYLADGDFGIIIMSFVGGMVAILTVSRLSKRSDLVKAGLYVSIANAAVIVTVYLLLSNLRIEQEFLRDFGYSLVAGLGNGFLSAIIAIGLLPFLESVFGLVTSVTLLELSNPNQSLLRELMMKAPGTYHHCIMVSNLAESAAEEVDADPLLTRVAAYYHDIGKTKRPAFFSENQFGGENPHEKLSPSLSTLIISSHVKDGVNMAEKEKLPQIIIDIIKQHHGTGMISFFYQKALENDRFTIDEENFRYEGPLPQTKEAGIIMLADVVEAGVRSLSNPNSEKISSMVKKMIKDKLKDGQLDECDLTMKDIDKIVEKFVYIINGMYHNRIEYPENVIKAEIEGGTSY